MKNTPLNQLPHLSEKKLLTKLSQRKYCLRVREEGESSLVLELCFKAKSGDLRPVALVPSPVARSLVGSGAVKIDKDQVFVTKAGRAYIKRALSLQDGFQTQHRQEQSQTRHINGVYKTVRINLKESPLLWLSSRKDRKGRPFIEAHQLAAGERLRADYERAECAVVGASDWERLTFGAVQKNTTQPRGLLMMEAMVDAKKRVRFAIDVVGPELGSVLLDVCCYHLGLEETERKNALPKRSGKVILRMALNQLARHYGLLFEDEGHRHCYQRLSHWGEEDYRPVFEVAGDLP